MRPALNPLVLSLKESATLAINLKALELRRRGENIVHFGFGQSPFPVPDVIRQALADNADKKDYLPTRGLPELCAAVAAVDFDGEQVLRTWPGKEKVTENYCHEVFPKIEQGCDCFKKFLAGLSG